MKTLISVLSLSIFIILIGTSCQNQDTMNNNKPEEAKALPVSNAVQFSDEQKALAGIKTASVELRDISSSVECQGQIDLPPKNIFSVYSPVNGFVKSVRHLPGDYVKKGAWLTSISHSELIRIQREYLEGQSQLKFLENEFQRKEILRKEDAGSQRALEESEANFRSKLASVNGIKAELELIGVSTKELLESGTIQSHINLYAPSSGYISEVNINQGKLVGPMVKLFEIIDTRHMHLELQVFAKDLPKIKKGQLIEAQLPGGGRVVQAKVHLVGKTIDFEKKTAMVHGHLEGDVRDLAVGMYLPARIYVDKKNVPAVPNTALVAEGGENFIFISKNGGFEKKQVQTGMVEGNFVELKNWTYPANTQVVIDGAYYIQENEE